MLLYGDEMRRTAEGDNNTVFQDNELNWINWENAKTARRDPPVHQADHRLPQAAPDRPALALHDRRRDRDADPPEHHLARRQARASPTSRTARDSSPGSSRPSRPTSARDVPIYVGHEHLLGAARRSSCPRPKDRRWYRVVDTSLPAGEDIVPEEEAFFLPEIDLPDPPAHRRSCWSRGEAAIGRSIDIDKLVRVENGQAEVGERLGRVAEEIRAASAAFLGSVGVAAVDARRIGATRPGRRGPGRPRARRGRPERSAGVVASVLFRRVRACGAIVVTARCGQLALVSGRSNASKNGIAQVAPDEDVEAAAVAVLGPWSRPARPPPCC